MAEEQTPQEQPQGGTQQGGSSTNMDPKLAALLSYLLGIIGGIIFIVIEKDNKYIRFHAAQSIVFFAAAIVAGIAIMVIGGILSAIPGLGIIAGLLTLVISLIYPLLIVAVAILLMVKAWTGYDDNETFKLPVLGGIADNIAGTK